jgi:hypothetical protein
VKFWSSPVLVEECGFENIALDCESLVFYHSESAFSFFLSKKAEKYVGG